MTWNHWIGVALYMIFAVGMVWIIRDAQQEARERAGGSE